MAEITKAGTVVFTKTTSSLVVQCRENHVTWEKKTKDGENLFFKALANRFWLTSKSYSWFNKLFLADLLSNALHEKVNDLLLKVD